jgi:hypothetical protein
MANVPRSHSASPNLRVGAIAGFFSLAFFIPAFLLLPTIIQAFDPSAVDRGLAQLASHRISAVVYFILTVIWVTGMSILLWRRASDVEDCENDCG